MVTKSMLWIGRNRSRANIFTKGRWIDRNMGSSESGLVKVSQNQNTKRQCQKKTIIDIYTKVKYNKPKDFGFSE